MIRPRAIILMLAAICVSVLTSRSEDVARQPPGTNAQLGPISPADQHILDEAHTLGLTSIEHDLPSPEENARLIGDMQHSTFMRILVLNGNNFFQNLAPALNEFKARPETHMQILLASPDSEFYREETNMVYSQKDIAVAPNKGKVNEAALRLHNGGPDDQRVEIRYFNTQFRLSMIILDNNSCYLTLRLSPHEPMDSATGVPACRGQSRLCDALPQTF